MEYLEFDKIISDFSEILQDFMSEQNLTINELANKTKITFGSIYMWLGKKKLANIENMIILSDFFKCSIDYLLGLTDNKTSVNYSQPYDFLAKFLARFSFLLNKNNIGIREFQKLTTISTGTISKWKRGVKPKTFTIVRLATLFDCSVEYLIGREN